MILVWTVGGSGRLLGWAVVEVQVEVAMESVRGEQHDKLQIDHYSLEPSHVVVLNPSLAM